jgi:prepilin-type N-terminal cleavage/methylation domain-containing protein
MENKGFTLVELVISIMIIAIIATVSVPGILSYQEKQTEDQFMNQFINQLRSLENISLTKDIYTRAFIANSVINFCEVEYTNCKQLTIPASLVDTFAFSNGDFYFDKYGNLLDSSKLPLDSYIINSKSYKITVNKYGNIIKENR